MKVFTTGKIAWICSVAPRTVSKWIDGGMLKGYRLPGSNDRRVASDDLLQFLKQHSMPLGNYEIAMKEEVDANGWPKGLARRTAGTDAPAETV